MQVKVKNVPYTKILLYMVVNHGRQQKENPRFQENVPHEIPNNKYPKRWDSAWASKKFCYPPQRRES